MKKELLDKITAYLGSRPYVEVARLINEIAESLKEKADDGNDEDKP